MLLIPFPCSLCVVVSVRMSLSLSVVVEVNGEVREGEGESDPGWDVDLLKEVRVLHGLRQLLQVVLAEHRLRVALARALAAATALQGSAA